MAWLQLFLDIDQSSAPQLSDWLSEQGAQAVTFEDTEDQPILEPAPGETPLWNKVTVIALFETSDAVTEIERLAYSKFPKLIIDSSISSLADKQWERAWMEHFEAMKFGNNLWICPSWQSPPEPHAVNIMLDPGLAFGSGTHETTALCLQWLDSLDLKDKRVIDYGCGSGILAIAAAKLGASIVVGTDNDPQAIIASRENARRNNVTEQQLVLHTVDAKESPKLKQVDILIANILAEPLRNLAPQLADLLKPQGMIGLSGILNEQAAEIKTLYQRWFDDLTLTNKGDWSFISGIKR